MSLTEIMEQLDEKTEEERIRILRKNRAQLLDEIHGKQQLLDQLDYMLYEIKRMTGGFDYELSILCSNPYIVRGRKTE